MRAHAARLSRLGARNLWLFRRGICIIHASFLAARCAFGCVVSKERSSASRCSESKGAEMNLTAFAVFIRVLVVALMAFFFAAAVPETGFAQPDPMIGVWKLNLAKSTYKPGPPPRSVMVDVHTAGDGLMAMSQGVDAQGAPTHTMFMVVCNGQPQPVSGVATIDAMSCRGPDPYSRQFTNMKGGRATTSGTLTISRDGRTMTISTKGNNANGMAIDNVAVYDKQ